MTPCDGLMMLPTNCLIVNVYKWECKWNTNYVTQFKKNFTQIHSNINDGRYTKCSINISGTIPLTTNAISRLTLTLTFQPQIPYN